MDHEMQELPFYIQQPPPWISGLFGVLMLNFITQWHGKLIPLLVFMLTVVGYYNEPNYNSHPYNPVYPFIRDCWLRPPLPQVNEIGWWIVLSVVSGLCLLYSISKSNTIPTQTHMTMVNSPLSMTSMTRAISQSTRGQITLILGPMRSGKTRKLQDEIRVNRISAAKRKERCLLIRFSKEDGSRFTTSTSNKTTVSDSEHKSSSSLVSEQKSPSTDPIKDTSKGLMNRDGQMDHDCLATEDLALVENTILTDTTIKYVYIDEGQFMKNLLLVVKWVRTRKDLHVIINALNGDATQALWLPIMQVLPYATKVHPMNAICELCGDPTAMISEEKDIGSFAMKTGEQRIGDDTYRVVCVHCSRVKSLI
jgi:thymidine kinase